MKCVIIGYGSIGQRQARILTQLDCRVAVVSEREIQFPLTYPAPLSKKNRIILLLPSKRINITIHYLSWRLTVLAVLFWLKNHYLDHISRREISIC